MMVDIAFAFAIYDDEKAFTEFYSPHNPFKIPHTDCSKLELPKLETSIRLIK